MSVSPLHLISNFNSYISGEVTIDPDAAIAIGVMLLAAPNSRIIISAGVCIGMGSVLHAHDGILEIEAGAIIGAGVLVVGGGKIGANACIGSATTILNCSIERGQIVAPGSLLGDTSRSFSEPQPANHTTATVTVVTDDSSQKEPESEHQIQPESTTPAVAPVVYGKASLNQLLSTLLPYNRSLNQQAENGSSPTDT